MMVRLPLSAVLPAAESLGRRAQCPNLVDQTILLRDFHGTGPTYEGFFRLYNSGNCVDSNEYPATITRSDDTHATVCAHFTGGVPDICQPMVRP